MTEPAYSPTELMICTASRLMENRSTAFIGTGVPLLAAALAQKTHAPELVSIFEFGGTGAALDDLPLAVGERRSFHRALAASGILDIVETAQRGFVDYGFLGGAQIDPFGNLNTTVIGDHDGPRVRLPGSGGGNDVGSHCWRTIVIMKHDRRRFVEEVDFLTTPGYLSGPGARERAGLPAGTGPYRVVTSLAVLGFDTPDKRMVLLATQPGVSVSQVQENTGFKLHLAPEITRSPPPTAEELSLLRDQVDPDRYYI